MEYGNAARQERATPVGKLSDQVPEQRALHSLCDQLEKHLSSIAEGVSRTQHFSQRLLDPKPEKTSSGEQGNPPATTIEGRMRYLTRLADLIGSALHAVASDLERAA